MHHRSKDIHLPATEVFSGRVLFIADASATHMLHWANVLARHHVEITYLSFEPIRDNLFRGLHIVPKMKNHYLKFIINAPRIAKIIKALNPDIVHSYYLTNYGLLAALARPKKLVITVAGSDLFLEPKKSKLFRYLNRITLRRASIVHAVAHHMVPELEKYGVERNKLFIAAEGIDDQVFRPFTDDVSKRENLITSTRNLSSIYDVETLIRAIPLVVKKQQNIRFSIFGRGPERSKLEKLVQSFSVEKYVRFEGFAPWSDLAKRLRESLLYISTSRSDGTSASLFQAMQSGAIPVVTDIPANREWVSDGENGFLFPVGDASELANRILFCLDNKNLLKAASEVNRNIIQENGLDNKIIKKLLHKYQSIVCK